MYVLKGHNLESNVKVLDFAFHCSFLAVLSCLYIAAVVTAKYVLLKRNPDDLNCPKHIQP